MNGMCAKSGIANQHVLFVMFYVSRCRSHKKEHPLVRCIERITDRKSSSNYLVVKLYITASFLRIYMSQFVFFLSGASGV